MDSLTKLVRQVAVQVVVLARVSQTQTAPVVTHAPTIGDALVTMAAQTTGASQIPAVLQVRVDLMTIAHADPVRLASSVTVDQAQRLRIRGRVRTPVL